LCKNLGAQKIIKAARKPKHNEVLFSDSNKYKTANVVINATPSGMYPNNYDELLIDLGQMNSLEAVVDLVYNPLETKLVSKAKSLNILGVNGLMMLVSQAVQSCELFHNQTYKKEVIINIYKEILFNMMNIIIIGMPMSGKSFYARALSKTFNKEITDIDEEIHHIEGISIPTIFKTKGENEFRRIESEVIMNVSKELRQAISTGGGSILNAKNIDYLKQNGIIIFLDASLEVLKGMNPRNRPLLKDFKNLETLYKDRHHLYVKYADITIEKLVMDENVVLNMIEVKINEYINTKWS